MLQDLERRAEAVPVLEAALDAGNLGAQASIGTVLWELGDLAGALRMPSVQRMPSGTSRGPWRVAPPMYRATSGSAVHLDQCLGVLTGERRHEQSLGLEAHGGRARTSADRVKTSPTSVDESLTCGFVWPSSPRSPGPRTPGRIGGRCRGQVADAGGRRPARSGIPPHVRRAAEVRDEGCVFAGCGAPTFWCDVHHLLEWINGGETSSGNSALLCERHHTKVHHGFRVERQPDGRWRTRRPDGTEILIGPRLDAAA